MRCDTSNDAQDVLPMQLIAGIARLRFGCFEPRL